MDKHRKRKTMERIYRRLGKRQKNRKRNIVLLKW